MRWPRLKWTPSPSAISPTYRAASSNACFWPAPSVQDADLFILDEPFQGIDAVSERSIAALFRSIQDRGGTVLAVHHDLATVREYFDHVLVLNVSAIAAGRIESAFTNEHLAHAYGVKHPLLPDPA